MVLSDVEREMLQSWVRRHSSAQALATRSRIVLESAEGHAIAEPGGCGSLPIRLARGVGVSSSVGWTV
jgi:hypothetical protein